MPRVQTYVFFDTETTGLPKEENYRTKITEFSFVAVKRDHLLATRPGATPRLQHRLTMCLNPRRRICTDGTEVTGLDNFLLEHEPAFDKEVFTIIDTFLKVLTQPVCLIAHNGKNFDFPILKNHIEKLKVSFSVDVLCADCYYCFYDVLEKNKKEELNRTLKVQDKCALQEQESHGTLEISSTNGSPSTSSEKQTNIEEIDFYSSNISMKEINETTPKRTQSSQTRIHSVKAVKRLFPWGGGDKPTDSYKLKNIYERVLNKPAMDAHRAENDCMFALEVAAALSKQFVSWVDDNNARFVDVVPMTVGVPM